MNDYRPVMFELYRYQILPRTRNVQSDMFPEIGLGNIDSVEQLKARKNELFWSVLTNCTEIRYRGSTLHRRVDLEDSPWFVMQLNTGKTLRRERPDFAVEQIDTWPHVTVIINNDPNVQMIAISRNLQAFSSTNVVIGILKRNLERGLQTYLLGFQIEAMFNRSEFWRLVKEYRGRIKQVEFRLISPNMSNISGALEIDLRQLNAETNTHQTNIKLMSPEAGTLEIKEEHSMVRGLADYAAQGGGDIALRIRGLRQTIRTSEGVRELSIDELTLDNVNKDVLTLLFDEVINEQNKGR